MKEQPRLLDRLQDLAAIAAASEPVFSLDDLEDASMTRPSKSTEH